MTDHTNARDKTGSIDLAGSPESSTFAETFNDGLCYYSVNVPRSPAGLIEWLQAKLLGTQFYEAEFGYGIVRHGFEHWHTGMEGCKFAITVKGSGGGGGGYMAGEASDGSRDDG